MCGSEMVYLWLYSCKCKVQGGHSGTCLNPSTQEADQWITVSQRSAWSKWWIQASNGFTVRPCLKNKKQKNSVHVHTHLFVNQSESKHTEDQRRRWAVSSAHSNFCHIFLVTTRLSRLIFFCLGYHFVEENQIKPGSYLLDCERLGTFRL